ncbi:hypothetical protein ABQE45_18060 [Mycobacteroides chelonae]
MGSESDGSIFHMAGLVAAIVVGSISFSIWPNRKKLATVLIAGTMLTIYYGGPLVFG